MTRLAPTLRLFKWGPNWQAMALKVVVAIDPFLMPVHPLAEGDRLLEAMFLGRVPGGILFNPGQELVGR